MKDTSIRATAAEAPNALPPGCHLGASGWSYPEWRGCFYPETLPPKEFLGYYQQYFPTVEVNSTFYGTPKPATVRHWYETTRPGFIFSVKASRYLTHVKRLAVDAPSIHRFFAAIEPLADKMGPILFQLPPRWPFNPARLSRFLQRLPGGYRYAFEFRDPDWLNPRAYELLSAHGAACCAYSLKGFEAPRLITSEFAYLRLHGPRLTPYEGCYSDGYLADLARDCRQWRQEGREVFCYFDNTRDAAALSDARRLAALLVC